LLALLGISGLRAQDLPALTGRVVDQANLLPPEREAQLTARLEQLERATTRQLVVVTVPDLQGLPVEDFAFALGEQWKIGDREADNGVILLVAPNEKRVRIEVGDGLEAILPDILAGRIIREQMTPRFKEGDIPGGIDAGAGAIVEQLQAPPEVAEQRALEAAARERERRQQQGGDEGSIVPLIIWGVVIVFIILPALFGRAGRGRTYRRRGWGMGGPVVIWGGGSGWGGGGGGFSGGGFSGGGGSFGGGGASGSW